MAYNPIITPRAQRERDHLGSDSIKFDPRDKVTAVEAWNQLKPRVTDWQLTPVSSHVERTVVGESGLIETVRTPVMDDSKRLLWKRGRNGQYSLVDTVSHGWNLPDVGGSAHALASLPLPVVRVRSVNRGDIVAFTFDAGSGAFGDTTIQRYLNAFVANAPNMAHSFFMSAADLWCTNMIATAFASADIAFRVNHNAAADPAEYIRFVVDLRSRVYGASEEIMRWMDRLATVRVDRDEAARIYREAFPYPSRPKAVRVGSDLLETAIADMRKNRDHSAVIDSLDKASLAYAQARTRIDVQRDLAMDALERYETTDRRAYPGTLVAVLAGGTEMITHRSGRGSIADSLDNGGRRAELERLTAAIEKRI